MSTIAELLGDERWFKRRPRRLYIVLFGFGWRPEVYASYKEAVAAKRNFHSYAFDVPAWIVRYDWHSER